jgi:hypothetical protein
VAGAWAFYKTQAVTKETFDPIIAACTSKEYATMDDFVQQTGYRAYDTEVGFVVLNPYICLTTQFLYQLRQVSPAGMMVWYATILTSLPVSVAMTIEAGRQGNRGLLLYPTIVSILLTVLGISVVFPALWVPAYCIWGNPSGGYISTTRARLAFPMTIPTVVLSVLVFSVAPDSNLWALLAGIMLGPLPAMLPLVLWGLGPPLGMSKEEKVISTETCAFAYAFAGVVALIGWFYLAYTYASQYGTDYEQFWNDIWAQADPAVKFMAIDAAILWVGLILHIATRSFGSMLEALLFSPFFGPGGACALALASNEMDNAPQLSATTEQRKKNN